MSTFIGRKAELASLHRWLSDPEIHKWALVGDGGKGKTAIAFEFASQVKRSNPTGRLTNVVWLSAKRRRLLEHTVTELTPDFVNLDGALDFLLDQFGETEALDGSRAKSARVKEFLNLFPSLIVVDDIDSVSPDNADVRAFFTDLTAQDVKILFTSRRELFGLETRETVVRGLVGDDATAFIHDKAREFGLDVGRFTENTVKLVGVTDGSPLYLEDLLRFCRITTVEKAIQQWASRGGEKAREYALQREIEELTRSYAFDRHVLIACALHEGPVSAAELGVVLNRSHEDVEESLEHLRQFFLLPEATISEDLILFEMPRNTRALVQAIYGKTDEAKKITGAFTALGKHAKEKGEDARIGAICRHGRLVAQSGKMEEALELLQELDRRYPERPQILQQIGWLYKTWSPPQFTNAREAFARAHALGHKAIELYWHWAELEEIDNRFKQAAATAEIGLDRLGDNLSLCFRGAHAHLLAARQLGRELDRESSIEELDRAIDLVRRGAPLSGAGAPDAPRLKSRLFEVGMRAALSHPAKRLAREMLVLWERHLPDDDYRAEYSDRISS